MDEQTNKTIKEHEITTSDWELSSLAQELYNWCELFNKRFFENILQTPVISFQRTRINTLGHFVIDRNSYGLKWNINLNRHYTDLPLMDRLAILLHEQLHLWQQEFGKRKNCNPRNNYHDVEFRLKASLLGIPSSIYGITQGYKDPFLSFLRDNEVELKSNLFEGRVDFEVPKMIQRKGRSKLKKWTCGCTNVRVAIGDFEAKCLKCNNLFELDEA